MEVSGSELARACIAITTGKLTYYPDAPGWIMSIVEDRSGKIWFTRSSLSDDKGPLCEVQGDRAACHGVAQGVPIQNARQLSEGADGNFWTVSDNTLMRWKDGRSANLAPARNFRISVRTKRSTCCKAWWPPPTVRSGLAPRSLAAAWDCCTLRDDKLQPFVAPGLDGRKLALSLVYVDRQNALWIGTQNEGVYRYHDGKVSSASRPGRIVRRYRAELLRGPRRNDVGADDSRHRVLSRSACGERDQPRGFERRPGECRARKTRRQCLDQRLALARCVA